MGGGGCCDVCCVGNCCVANCGFCCVFKSSCGDCCVGNTPPPPPPCSDNVSTGSRSTGKSTGGGRSTGGSSSSTYRPSHDEIIMNELATMRQKATDEAKKEEDALIAKINENVLEFREWLKEVNSQKYGGRSLSINIDKIEKINATLRAEIVGFIGQKLDDRLVKGDKEVSTILAETNDKNRKKNFQAFYDRIFNTAIRGLMDKIDASVRKQSAEIEREISNRIQEVQNSMDEETRAYEQLQFVQGQEKSKLEEKQVEYMFYENLCDMMLENLDVESELREGA